MTMGVIVVIVGMKATEMAEKKDKEEMTTIPVSKKVASALRKLGNMDDTYNTVILRLMDGNGRQQKEVSEEDGDVVRRGAH